jgi:hypothetical protein
VYGRWTLASYQPDAAPVDLQQHLKIWRYVDPLRLLSLLETRSLFFPRADMLGDPHEGALGTPNAEKFRKRVNGLPEDEKKQEIKRWTERRKTCLKSIAISCWHLNEHESAAMWELYALRGVAIQSTVERLHAAIRRNPREILMSKVNYCDYETQEIDEEVPVFRFIAKRKAFEHENELRLYLELTEREISHSDVAQSMRNKGYNILPGSEGREDQLMWWGDELREQFQPEGGIYVPVDVDQLIERLVVSPKMPAYAPALFRRLLSHYGLNQDVVPSNIDRPPFDQVGPA